MLFVQRESARHSTDEERNVSSATGNADDFGLDEGQKERRLLHS